MTYVGRPRPRESLTVSSYSPPRGKDSAEWSSFDEAEAYRRNSSTSFPVAISTPLAMLMNRPCSTTPGISLRWRASVSGSAILPKWQSRGVTAGVRHLII
jgi:hypothetical protein